MKWGLMLVNERTFLKVFIVKIYQSHHIAFITIYHHLVHFNQATLLFIVATLFAVNVTSRITGDNWKQKKVNKSLRNVM